MKHLFEQKLDDRWPAADWANVTVLVAVSGGPDSMALLRGTLAIRTSGSGRVIAVHFNHRLRGAESDADETFVCGQAAQLNCPVVVDRAEDSALTSTSEDDARKLRYDFFCRTAKEWGARFVSTAHTADDQAETILHRILRGTGIDGLAGIPFSRQLLPGVSLVRPLLTTSRSEVLEYLDSIGQTSRSDSTNAQSRFTRNRLRNELIPLLEREYNPQFKEAILRLGQLAGESQAVIAAATRDLLGWAVKFDGSHRITISCDQLDGASNYLVRQLIMDLWRERGWPLRDMSWEHWRQLAKLASTDHSGFQRVMFPGGIFAERNGSQLSLDSEGASSTR